ncbi:MAG: DNA repair protein RadA, partial [Parcubacteria group bacterium]
MAKSGKTYVCQKCGAEFIRWSGKCEGCGEWNCLAAANRPESTTSRRQSGNAVKPVALTKASNAQGKRISTGIVELDQVLGGGIVPGSIIVLG